MSAIPPDPAGFAQWLDAEGERLLAFAEGSRHPAGGFGWLDADGSLDRRRPVETWITSRMTYVFALAALRGREGAGDLVDHGLVALRSLLHDDDHGGWFPADPRHGVPDEKRAYDHAFVLLASSTATLAGRPGAAELMADVLDVVERRFWDASAGLSLDVWNRDWTTPEAYRGANANMHLTEAFGVAAQATGDPVWRDRALGIAERLVHGEARAHRWRLPEHFDTQWQVLPEYNRDAPDHPFRPFGATVGHWFEWARLCAHLHLALDDPPAWLLQDAAALFEAGVREGWAVDGADGFVYTVDAQGTPVVRARMHWVVTEAIGAAAVLSQLLGTPGVAGPGGDEDTSRWLRTWWDYAARYLVDTERGSWHHELDTSNGPDASVWEGKPDVYHAYQAVLLCRTAPAASVPAAVLGDARG